MPTRNGEEMEDAPHNKASRTEENRVPNVNVEFAIHEDGKGAGSNNPPNDNDLRYTRILETITKTAPATREEVVSSAKSMTDQLTDQINQTDKKLSERIDHLQKPTATQMDKLTNDVPKLQIAFDQGIKNCSATKRQTGRLQGPV